MLFDPVFEDRCSPVSWLGPKRYTEMPCEVSDLPVIDAVVISHNHYDHLSYPTIKEIAKAHPNCHFFAPLGNKQWFTSSGIHNVTELDWWDQRDISLSPSSGSKVEVGNSAGNPPSSANDIEARISCLPCQHTSNRGIFDRSKTLWASWSIESGGQNVYFAGYVTNMALYQLFRLMTLDFSETLVTERYQISPSAPTTTRQSLISPLAPLSNK